jgi:hypothetical protein
MRWLERSLTSGSRMKAASLRDEVVADSLALAWGQWSQLGISGYAPARREERAADPEALLLFTLEVARNDPRLFDEVLDWLSLNEQLVSVQRLRNLCAGATDAALVGAALDSIQGARGRTRPQAAATTPPRREALFPSFPIIHDSLDESFARFGFERPPAKPSGKSQPPRLRDPISFAFRLRRLLGIGVRAEVVRALLTIRAERLSGKVITATAAFAQRNVREGLNQLVEAGAIDVVELSDDRYYSIRHAEWAAALGLDSAPDLPFHHDWIPTYRALARIVRWLGQPGLDDLSPYLRASEARTLVDELADDLRFARVPLGLYTALGADFWTDFEAIVRTLIRGAQPPE